MSNVQFLAHLVTALAGGAIGGIFVLIGVNFQFYHQSNAALRALILEVDSNAEIGAQIREIVRSQAGSFPDSGPNPGWLKRSVWDSQLPLVVQVLDEETLRMASEAYGSLDPVSRMFYRFPDQPQGSWMIGGWVDSSVERIANSFRSASQALHSARETLDSQGWTKRVLAALQTPKKTISRERE